MKIQLATFLLLFSLQISKATEGVSIQGKILNSNIGNVTTSFYSNPSVLEKATINNPVNGLGEFEAFFLISEPQVIALQLMDRFFELYLEPGKDLGILIDLENKLSPIEYFEKNQEKNNYFLNKYRVEFELPLVTIYPSHTIPKQLFEALKELDDIGKFNLLNSRREKAILFYDQIKMEKISENFSAYLKFNIQYSYLSNLKAFVNYAELSDHYQLLYDDEFKAQHINNASAANHLAYKMFLDVFIECECEKLKGHELNYNKDFITLYDCISALDEINLASKEQVLGRLIYLNSVPKKIEQLQPVYKNYLETFQNSTLVEKIEERYKLAQQFSNGQKIPTHELENLSKEKISLLDFQGKKIYVSFWAKWCGACKVEIAAAEENRKKLKDEAIEFVFISIDELKSDWINHNITNTQTGIHLWGGAIKNELMRDFGITSLPRNFLIDKEGRFLSQFPSSSSEEFLDYIFRE